MFVAGGANGLIDRFRWDGNNWIPGETTVEPPAASISALRQGPDGRLYALDGSLTAGLASVYIIDPVSGSLAAQPVTFPGLTTASGISWSADNAAVFLTGISRDSSRSSLLTATWPSAQPVRIQELPLETVRQVVTSPDGKFLYVMGRGKILKIDTTAGAVISSFDPASSEAVDFADADFSADGRYMFVTGTPPAGNSGIYVVDLETLSSVSVLQDIGVKVLGIQRVQ